MNGWLPIETAPKDGTEIDLWVVCRNIEIDGSVRDSCARRIADAFWIVDERRAGKGYWCIYYEFHPDAGEEGELSINTDDGMGQRTIPTHWRPLPSPPEAE